MKFEIRKSFVKDCNKIPAHVKKDLAELFNKIEEVESSNEIPNCKKLKGSINAYRIRIGNYRIGFYIVDDCLTFSRLLHRKDMYKYFPK